MINNERISLRGVEPADLDFLFETENDTALWHVTQTTRPYSRFDLEQYVFSVEKDPFRAGQVRFIIELNDTSETIGTVDLFDIDGKNRRAGVGILILEKYRNRGYAAEALSLLRDYAFNTLELHQLYCNIEEDNESSLKLFKKEGFEVSGLKKDWNLKKGQWSHEYFLQLIRR